MAPVTLTGRTAVVTGGSRGIGYATAEALLHRGASVAIAGTTERTLAPAAERLRRLATPGAVVVPVQADVRQYDEVVRLIETAADRCGGVDVLVNNAGVATWRPVADMSVEEWAAQLDTNLTGVF